MAEAVGSADNSKKVLSANPLIEKWIQLVAPDNARLQSDMRELRDAVGIERAKRA